MHTQNYIHQHRERFLQELCDFLRIPSVSTQPQHAADVQKAAQFVQQKLLSAGCDQSILITTKKYPLCYAEKIIDPKLPTILVYGHYDVQPIAPAHLWTHPPFEPIIRDGKIYARGASDDKGQLYLQIKAIETMIANHCLPCNVKFLVEGEEESGSESIIQFLSEKKNQDLVQADIILISDTTLLAKDLPSISISTRGITYVELTLTTAKRDLHSGLYGGAVANPIQTLCHIISQLKDPLHKITIPGFYDNVQTLSQSARNVIQAAPFDTDAFQTSIGALAVGEVGYTTPERVGARPALDINGIWGGYIEAGAKTVLPAQAHAKFSIRLVPNQTIEEIEHKLCQYLHHLTPTWAKLDINIHSGGGNAIFFDHQQKCFQAASLAFAEVWGNQPFWTRGGGSLPVITQFKEKLGLDCVLMGFGLPSDAVHAPDEHFHLDHFFKGMTTVIAFYQHFVRSTS